MKKPRFRSLAEKFYLGQIAIENDMSAEHISRFLNTMVAEGITHFMSKSIIHIRRTKDPDTIEAYHCFDRTKQVYKLSEVLKDSVTVERVSGVFDTLYIALTKLSHPVLRELAIRNIDLDFALGMTNYETVSKITEPSDALKIAFSWQNTNEGVAFWSGVHELVDRDAQNVNLVRDIVDAIEKISASKNMVYLTVDQIADRFKVDPQHVVIV